MKIVEISNPPSIEHLIECFGRRELPFILDSSQSNDGLGHWSFFGADPFEVVEASALAGSKSDSNPPKGGTPTSPLAQLRDQMKTHKVVNDTEIPFVGGAVGFIAYDYGRRLECIPNEAVDDREVPDLHFGLYDGVAALDHRTGVLHLIALGIRADEQVVIDQLCDIIASQAEPQLSAPRASNWKWNMSRSEFLSSVDRVKDYIASGDVYQVNLSQRARCHYEGEPLQLYKALRVGNPAPYSGFIDAGELQVFSTSPEQFLRKRGRSIETRPIKGTRPRGVSAEEDMRNAEALRVSEKDRAELLMIVDLERNDLGRVAEFGSVQVEGLYHLELYARVIHQTAQVKATLAEGKDVFDCIEALFPGGSITGAPKVRAMEIIEELEPTRRGVYCGSVGYIGFDGDAELNIAIRSLHLTGACLDYQVGGGIVWDSDPESEYQETLDKGRAIRETIDALCQSRPS